jgi:hypothetical protein
MTIEELDRFITEKILKPIRREYNIEGAPFEIGDIVQVLNNPSNDETFNSNTIGKVGKVIFFEYDCDCGQTYPHDPMIGVRFSNNLIEEYWREELIKKNKI